MAGEVTYVPLDTDYVAAQRDWFAHFVWSLRGLRTLALTALTTACTMAAVAALTGDPPRAISIAFAAGVGLGVLLLIVCWALGYILLPRRARRLFHQQRTLHKEHTYGWSDDGLAWRSLNGSGVIPWGELHRWDEGRQTFLFLMNDRLFHFLPRRLLSDGEAEDLRRTVAAFVPQGR